METKIDLQRIKDALPINADVTLTKYNGSQLGKGSLCIRIFIDPAIPEENFEECKQWQREILGDSINEFYTEETGRLWYIYLKFNNKPITFEI